MNHRNESINFLIELVNQISAHVSPMVKTHFCLCLDPVQQGVEKPAIPYW